MCNDGFSNAVVFYMQGEKVKERLTPVLNLLSECSRGHRDTRRYLRQQARLLFYVIMRQNCLIKLLHCFISNCMFSHEYRFCLR